MFGDGNLQKSQVVVYLSIKPVLNQIFVYGIDDE